MRHFIAYDRGTTSLRAHLMDGRGRVVAELADRIRIPQFPAPGGAVGFHADRRRLAGTEAAAGGGLGSVGKRARLRRGADLRCPADILRLSTQAARLAAGGTLPTTLLLIGESALCVRHRTTTQEFGIACAAVLENIAPAGLYRFARAAGLPGSAVTAKDYSA